MTPTGYYHMTRMLRDLGVGMVLALEGFVTVTYIAYIPLANLIEPMTWTRKIVFVIMHSLFLRLSALSRPFFIPNGQN